MATATRAPLLVVLGLAALAQANAAGGLFVVEAKIPLPAVKGRIDHLAFDAAGNRLFIAELGNDSVSIVDVQRRLVERRITDLSEPQGVAYSTAKRMLYVACGGDGTLRAYRSTDFMLLKSAKLGADADNVRIDGAANQLYVGYGSALAVLDLDSLERVADIALKGHPESFQFSPLDSRIFVNVPDSTEIAVVDRAKKHQVASWPVSDWRANYPMAIDPAAALLLAVFRLPAVIAAYPLAGGNPRKVQTCGDADDVFVDGRRKRVYVICGEGAVEALESDTLRSLGRTSTSPGARTGLYSAEADLLFVAARARDGNDAAIWVLKPTD